MAHFPVNHPARPVYRALGGLTGLYLAGFGVLGVIENSGAEFFAQDDTLVLGQGANLGYSVISAILGVIILAAAVIGRNIDATVNKLSGYGFMVLGLAGLAVLRTDANFLDFSVATTIVAMTLGIVLMTAGLYGKVGTDEENRAWQEARLLL